MMFLTAAWVIFLASGRSMAASALLVFAGAFALCNVIPKIRKELKKCQ